MKQSFIVNVTLETDDDRDTAEARLKQTLASKIDSAHALAQLQLINHELIDEMQKTRTALEWIIRKGKLKVPLGATLATLAAIVASSLDDARQRLQSVRGQTLEP